MSFDARVYRVLIASPGDVGEERTLVRRLMHRWNSANAGRRRIILLPVGWELDSTPDMSAPAQEIINKGLGKDADILVGIFWNRIGTPTENWESGTVEEIERHIRAGKKAMLYFSDRAVPPSRLDPDQMARVTSFRKRCEKRGLLGLFSDREPLEGKFQHDLDKELNRQEYDPIVLFKTESTPDEPEAAGISRAAKRILFSAASGNGRVLLGSLRGGAYLLAGEINLVVHGDSRLELETWNEALEELRKRGFLRKIHTTVGLGFEITPSAFEHFVAEGGTESIRIEATIKKGPPPQELLIRAASPIDLISLTFETRWGRVLGSQALDVAIRDSYKWTSVPLQQNMVDDLYRSTHDEDEDKEVWKPTMIRLRFSKDGLGYREFSIPADVGMIAPGVRGIICESSGKA